MYWWEYLQQLKEDVPSSPELIALLTAASKAVVQDAVWESSGIERMLLKAREQAAVCADTARKEALHCLGFHSIQQRTLLLSATSSGGSGELLQDIGKLSSGSASPSSDEDAVQTDAAVSLETAPTNSPSVPLLNKRRRVEAGNSATSVDQTFSVPSQKRLRSEQQGETEFAVPRVLPRRRVGPSGLSQTSYSLPHLGSSTDPGAAKQSQTAATQPSMQQQPHLWSGSMHLHLEDHSSSELCHAQVQLPQGISRHILPQRLVFTHIVQRRGVTLGKHQVCRTYVTKANAEQGQSLSSMAVNELVAVSSQGSTAFILVPYLDSKKWVKLAGFLLQF